LECFALRNEKAIRKILNFIELFLKKRQATQQY
jgi:hypothetical protein